MRPTPFSAMRILVVAALLLGLPAAVPAGAQAPQDRGVPRARCGPGSLPETAAQGRAPASDVASGRASKGYFCNARVVGHYVAGGNFKALRYVDRAGHECAYFDTPQTQAASEPGLHEGVQVLDMRDPRLPVLTATLTSPAMISPHESLLLNQRRGLLVAAVGNAGTSPAFVDVYDVTRDCRSPRKLASTPLGILGHESGMSPDGRTFWVTSAGFGTIAAVDLSDPARPSLLTVYRGASPHGVRLSADGNTMYVADLGQIPLGDAAFDLQKAPGLRILDVSQVQRRVANPVITEISTLTWPDKSTPQVAEPITIRGHRYLAEVDEFSTDLVRYDPASRVGGARLISIDDPRRPKVVSTIKLEVNTTKERSGPQQDDPSATLDLRGYTAHYCNVPRAVDPGILACTFIKSGLRVFDIRDPLHPRELAYANPPSSSGSAALSAPAFVPGRREIWFTDMNSGFWAVRLTEAGWPEA